MAVNWKTGFDPSELANRIEQTRKVGDDGSVSFESGFDFKVFDTLLYSMLDFSDDIPEIEGRNIARRSIFDAGEKGEITPQRLLAEVNILENKYLKQPIERFVLSTSISIRRLSILERIYIGRTQIIFENQLPRRFIQEATELRREAENILYADPPNNYMAVRVHQSAKSPIEAAYEALDAVDVIRGIWNLYENKRHYTRWSMGGNPLPVNKVILGPYHLLHFPNGKLASTSRWWYEQSYLGAVAPHRFNDLSRLNKYTSDIRNRLAKSHYGGDLEGAIIRYTRALDERDWNHAFIRLWGVLELLTDTIRLSHDQTIKRAAFIYQDHEYHLQILKQLRDYRNRTIHADAENSEMESFLYQLKNFIEDLLYFHLGNNFGFKTIQDAGNFLGLPRDKEALNYRADMANKALRFFSYKK
jgi:hypothetical protein